MTSRDALIAPPVQAFLAPHRWQHTRVSPQTTARDRDPCRLVRTCGQETTGQAPSTRHVADRDAPIVLTCLASLAHPRGQAGRSRHRRWAASRSWARVRAWRDPEH
jgi:hypothetical protein